MPRVRAILLLSVAVLSLVGAAVAWRDPVTDPLTDPRPGDWHEWVFATRPRAERSGRLVVWLGDSIVMDLGGMLSYPVAVERDLLAPAGIESVVQAGPGFTFYQYYCLTGRLVDIRPTVIVIGLNLRTFRTTQANTSLLCSHVPPGELPRSLLLPVSDSGLSFPQLVLAQTLRWSAMRRAGRLLERTRERLDGAREGLGFPPHVGPAVAVWRVRELLGPTPHLSNDAVIESWRDAVRPRTETLAMLDATVRLGRSSGAHVVVVVSPAPATELAAVAAWDGDAYGRLIDRVRTIVESRGGTLVDLHDAVPQSGFRDGDGFDWRTAHLNAAGATAVADRLAPVLAGMLGLPRP